MTTTELRAWLTDKLAAAEKALKCRKDAAKTWREGSTATWRSVGCKLPLHERLKLSEQQDRIAVICQRDVDGFTEALNLLQNKL